MFKVTALLLLRLLLSSIIIVGPLSAPYAYADSGGDSDSDSGDDSDSDSDSDSDADSDSGSDSGSDGSSSNDNSSGNDEHEGRRAGNKISRSIQRQIRKAVQQNAILPLSTIKRIVTKKTRSEILRIELERKRGRWIYEFKVVDRKGRLLEIYVNAKNGDILRSKYD